METLTFAAIYLSLALVLALVSRSVRAPGVVAILLFTALYLWNRLGALSFSYVFGPRHALYLLLAMLVFSGTSVLVDRYHRAKWHGGTAVPASERRVALTTWFIMAVGMMGGLLWAVDILRSAGGVGAVANTNLAAVRDQFIDRSTSILGQAGSFMLGGALPGLLLGIRLWLARARLGRRGRWLTLVLLVGLVGSTAAVSLVSGGRQAVLMVVVCGIAVILYGDWRRFSVTRRRLLLLVGACALPAAVGYFLAVASQRATYGMANESFLLEIWAADYNDWFASAAPDLPPGMTGLVVAVHGYYPYNLTGLAVWIDDAETAGLGMGRYQGRILLRQIQRFGFEYPFYSRMGGSYPGLINWPTAIGIAIQDFGLLGALVELGLLGWLAGLQYARLRCFHSLSGYLYTGIALVYLVQSLMYSPTTEGALFYGLLWSLVIAPFIRPRVFLRAPTPSLAEATA